MCNSGHQTSNPVIFLKIIVYRDNLYNLTKLKLTVKRHARNISPDMLRSTVENGVMSIIFLSENGEHQIERLNTF